MAAHRIDDTSHELRRWLRDLSALFIRLPAAEIDEAIQDGLRAIIEFLDVDRSTLFQFVEGGASLVATHSSARSGVEPFPLGPFRADIPWYHEQLARGEVVILGNVLDDLPPIAVEEREYIRRVGIRSNLTIPVVVGDRPVCALAIGSFRKAVTWHDDIVDNLQLAGEILGAALDRRQRESEVEALRELIEEENLYLQEEIKVDHDFENIVGTSEALRAALSRVERVAPTGAAVLLLGETGTGKELLAHALHERSARSSRALIKINCAALPSTLIESELFGHTKGAFTGAIASKKGRFELADGGTLFLDEIGDLDLDLQAKLLRVLQSGELERVGSTQTLEVDVRIIAATHRDLMGLVLGGEFREDLYHRLNAVPITVPPLRERRTDITLLTWHFLAKCEQEWGHRLDRVPASVMDALRSYSWPGNVRELKNVIERAVILSPGDELRLDPGSLGPVRERPDVGRDDRLDSVQRLHILRVLEDCNWRINGPDNAAERLGVHPNTLRHRMKKLGVHRPE
jgi:transcriptional regulator with GAF, ATPase, and Fis domain